MPIFEYHCEDCSRQFELLVRSDEHPVCPACQSVKLEKLMSVSAGRVTSGSALPISQGCPPMEAGPCSPHCCRLP